MKSIATYFLQMLLCSGLLYCYYLLFLKNRKLHRFNRFFLLGSLLLSLLVPFIKVPLYISITTESNIGIQTLVKYNELLLPEVVVSSSQNAPVTFAWILCCIYCGIVLFLVARVIAGLAVLIKKRAFNNTQRWHSLLIVETNDAAAPYSFFNWLFWSPAIDEHTERGKKILQHEYLHIKQWHSADVLFSEIITALVWVNPFFWLMKNELKAVHEFSADAYAAKDADELEYATLLITEAIHYKQQQLAHPFFNNQLKRRINMLTKPHAMHQPLIRQWMALPLFILLSVLFIVSCQSADQAPEKGPDSTTNGAAAVIPDNNGMAPDSSAAAPAATDTAEVKEVRMAPPRIVKDPEVKEVKTFTPPKIVRDNEPEVYSKVQKDAAYPGNWSQFLERNLRGEVPVEHGAKAGNYQVIAQFVVDRAGNVSDVKIIKDPGFGMAAEVKRVIRQSGRWTPAVVNGKSVKAYRKQPITFVVTEA
ncbi:M56 family metallopeptidase [Niabella drilacis]|uniref:Signal transducer regulating beta-lactamase production, contains metallopeptidase domain n=1 Tax=Niabella drilacis (strain DSM 25811 / CCM 8410 / CCUG 62505 / LMG 26954 / E90) TaxID=1285928 RepID=A0A1G6YDM7_NIADE|nr:M56 family metallopeptidase [Niabella drilacis]SDD88432.1 Signal transducer regulating beta-lactamase production, contains metallopeptidase domain [Niabella drilacis]